MASAGLSLDDLGSKPIEEVAGYILEQLQSAAEFLHISNYTNAFVNALPASRKDGARKIVLEAWHWLESNGMIAPDGGQPGTYFLTRVGREIGTAANLKVHLQNRQSDAAAAYERAQAELAAMRSRAAAEIKASIEATKKEGQAILQLARETAQGVSLEDVQKQFTTAAQQCLWGVIIWAALSLLTIVAFIIILIGLLTWWAPSFQAVAQAQPKGATQVLGSSAAQVLGSSAAIYNTVIRVTLLTAIGAVATFCLRILRAQMHMREQNLHRQRLANTITAFLGAASPDQRDVVLGRMIDAITAFGNSGLLTGGDDSISPAKVILESLPRAVSSKS